MTTASIEWGRDSFPLFVVGTSHCQGALRAICGRPTEDGHDGEYEAVLAPEPDNAFDAEAVVVRIEGRKVGYLAQDQARRIGRQMAARGIEAASCRARVQGGWDRGGEDRGLYGVRLAVAKFGDVFEG